MPKIVSDEGVVIYFSDYDILKNGDIFIHGATNKLSPVPMPTVKPPKLEVTKPVNRVAMKPVIEKPKLGLMCPICHQSHVFHLVVGEGEDPDTIVYISEEEVYIAYLGDLVLPANPAELRKFYENETLMNNYEPITMIKLAKQFQAATELNCPLCDNACTIQDTINEYTIPSVDYMNICICGGEMLLHVDDGTPGGVGKRRKHNLVCETCGFSKDQ
jgi:hypothetical protein